MALPVTISGGGVGAQNSFHGPHRSGNAVYTALIGGAGIIDVWKATDPTVSFSIQDGATSGPNVPSAGSPLSVSDFQKGTDLYVVVQGPASNESVEFGLFHMGTDLWGTNNDVTVDDPSVGEGTDGTSACDICVLDDDKIRIAYQGELDKVMGTAYARIHHAWSTNGGTSFTAALALSVAADEGDSTGPRIATDGTDAWVVWHQTHDTDVNNIFEASIHLDNSVQSTLQDTGFQLATNQPYGMSHGVVFDRLGVKKIRFVFGNQAQGNDMYALEFDVSQDPTLFTDTLIYAGTFRNVNGGFPGCLAVDGSTVHFLITEDVDDDVDALNDQDADNWSLTDNPEFASTLIDHISCNVIWRDGPKLAYIMDDNGTVKYNEKAITYTLALLSDAEMADQNQFAGPFEV